MLATYTCARAAFAVLILQLIAGIPSQPQSILSLGALKTSNSGPSLGTKPGHCVAPPGDSTAALPPAPERAAEPVPNRESADFNIPAIRDTACVQPALPDPPRFNADNPCLQKASWPPAAPDGSVCGGHADAVRAGLSALGKTGEKIEEARGQVLDILNSENACAEWFETKDARPGRIFQSLNYAIDHHGPLNIYESELPESLSLFREPYVAQAIQDGGAYSTITINLNGAFYRPRGNVQKLSREVGPVAWDGTRELQVGGYRGDTPEARMVTLLHEFGHVIDLLPLDADNMDGKSVRNTDEVLRHCRAEVETRAQQPKQMAKR